MRVEGLIPETEIDRVHANANFGETSKRAVVNYALLKCACGYSNGHTATQILSEHRLIKPTRKRGQTALTPLGRQYLWAAFGDEVSP